jgi:hypothetical protein
LLMNGKVDGPQPITLISQSISRELWPELGIEPIQNR